MFRPSNKVMVSDLFQSEISSPSPPKCPSVSVPAVLYKIIPATSKHVIQFYSLISLNFFPLMAFTGSQEFVVEVEMEWDQYAMS